MYNEPSSVNLAKLAAFIAQSADVNVLNEVRVNELAGSTKS